MKDWYYRYKYIATIDYLNILYCTMIENYARIF